MGFWILVIFLFMFAFGILCGHPALTKIVRQRQGFEGDILYMLKQIEMNTADIRDSVHKESKRQGY
jgi:hypothetical protein